MMPAIRIWAIEISTYWLMLFVGAVGMLICIWKQKDVFSLTRLQCILFTCLLTLVGIVGAKLLYILENIPHTIENGISLGGVSFFGSLYLIPILMPLIGRAFRLNFEKTMDICGPCVAIMIGCLRFGCFLQGCCGGWLVHLGKVSFFWPTQAIESIGDFFILFWLLEKKQMPKFQGGLYPLLLIGYSCMRFMLEFLRDTPKDWLWLSHGQWFSITAIIIGLLWIIGLNRKRERRGYNT